jgi:capsid protein
VSLWQRIKAWFEGARQSPARGIICSPVQSARFDATAATRTILVGKSRYFEQNNAIQNRLADIFESYTVGSGLVVNPASSSPEWNEKAKAWWDEWCLYPDLTSRQTFASLQALAARSWFVDGEIFCLKTRGEKGFARIQMFEGHLVGTPPDLRDQEGLTIVDGCQLDQRTRRPIGYYVAEEDPRGKKSYGSPKSWENVWHIFEPSRPGQYRGLPFCYPVINDLQDLDELQMLEMVACKDAAEKTNVVNNESGEVPDEELLSQGSTVTNETPGGASATVDRARYVHDALGGRTVYLRNNEKLTQHVSQRPNVATKDYWRFMTEKVCIGQGVPYCLAFPETMQGTVYRGALDMANAWFRSRSAVIGSWSVDVYKYVMGDARYKVEALRDAPGDWWKATVTPPRAVNVDVGRNSAAMIAELRAGVRTFQGTYGDQGEDWRRGFRARAEACEFIMALAQEKKIPLWMLSDLLMEQPSAPAPATESTEPDPQIPAYQPGPSAPYR